MLVLRTWSPDVAAIHSRDDQPTISQNGYAVTTTAIIDMLAGRFHRAFEDRPSSPPTRDASASASR
jgi:hypothetical protein